MHFNKYATQYCLLVSGLLGRRGSVLVCLWVRSKQYVVFSKDSYYKLDRFEWICPLYSVHRAGWQALFT